MALQRMPVTCPSCKATRTLHPYDFNRRKSDLCTSCYGKQWKRTHGGSRGNKLYSIWRAMRARCGLTAGCDEYTLELYHERGISCCPEWASSFEAFRGWALSNGYKTGLLLDRRDNDGNYEPANCRWITSKESAANRRNPWIKRRGNPNVRATMMTGD